MESNTFGTTAYKGSNAANLASNLEAPDITAKAEVHNITKQINQVELGNPVKPPKELVKPEIKRPSDASDMLDLTDFVDTTLKRVKKSAYNQVDMPDIEEVQATITSGKALKAIYWPLIVRCKEKIRRITRKRTRVL